jgi:hypothetical protein
MRTLKAVLNRAIAEKVIREHQLDAVSAPTDPRRPRRPDVTFPTNRPPPRKTNAYHGAA